MYTLSRFYANYATTASIVFFNQLPDHYKSDLSEASHTRHATHAVALASAARQLHQPGLMLEARQHYGKAIGTLNQALRDPVRARDDGNLVTMFLFGMFEVSCGILFKGGKLFASPLRNNLRHFFLGIFTAKKT